MEDILKGLYFTFVTLFLFCVILIIIEEYSMETIATYKGSFSDPYTEEEYIDFKTFMYKVLEKKAKENDARLLTFVVKKSELKNNTYISVRYTFKFEDESKTFEEYVEIK